MVFTKITYVAPLPRATGTISAKLFAIKHQLRIVKIALRLPLGLTARPLREIIYSARVDDHVAASFEKPFCLGVVWQFQPGSSFGSCKPGDFASFSTQLIMSAESERTVKDLFALAIDIEFKIAELYKKLSKLFAHVPKLALYWDDLVRDEEHHWAVLIDVVKHLTPEQLHSPADAMLWTDLLEMHQMLVRLAGQPTETLDDAYELAHEVEFSEINVAFKLLATKFTPTHVRRQFLSMEIKQHQQKLTEFSQRFGNKAWRKQIVAQQI